MAQDFGIREREAPSGLFGDTVSTVVNRFQVAKKQSEALRQFIPRQVYYYKWLLGDWALLISRGTSKAWK